MHLAVVSHKVCWTSKSSPSGYMTDGGFPLQMAALSELFDETRILVPCESEAGAAGLTELIGNNMSVRPLSVPRGAGFKRKIRMIGWVVSNSRSIWREIRRADAVHAPIPGDVGTIGMVFALLQRKPLFVRHCGNWLVQTTVAERFWKWAMERFAGGRNVMLATGGAVEPPSKQNSNIRWIFSSSLRSAQLGTVVPRKLGDGSLRLIIACRQEENKGTGIVIASLPLILKSFPDTTLDVVGDGSLLEKLKLQAASLGVGDRVTFHGKIEQVKVLDLLKRADVFCYPTSASEGFPKVVLEALACGLPVITTRVSVLPQLIGQDAGILLSEATRESLAAAVVKICSDKAGYVRMSANAIEVASQYTLEKWRDDIGAVLRSTWKVADLSSAPVSRGIDTDPCILT
jgi:hypothetical protein